MATDTGHKGAPSESAWAKGRPERVRDHGWRVVHLSTVAAKQLVTAFYGRGPDKSYFVGCSGGGRQGLMEAARFPEDYDGILAGAPAANWTDLAIALIHPLQAQMPPGAAIRPDQVGLIQHEVLRQCDAIDGTTDLLVQDPRQCKLDYSRLACGTADPAQCFSPPQIAALKLIHAGPHDSTGRKLAGGYLPGGSEAGNPTPYLGWETYLLHGGGGYGGRMLASGLLGDLVQKPFATPETFDFDKDVARLKADPVAEALDASPNLQRFFNRGGKLILWHGWADAAISPEATLRYHDAMIRLSGPRAAGGSQLFMVPGVQHCFGGTGPAVFGQMSPPQVGDTPENSMVAALQAWVEDGRRPESLVGRMGFGSLFGLPEKGLQRQRLLCAWPSMPVLRPGGNPDKAVDYACIAREGVPDVKVR